LGCPSMAERPPWPALPHGCTLAGGLGGWPRQQRPKRRPSSASSYCRRSRPSSASSSYSAAHIAKGDFGYSPWQACIEGGNHASYSEFGCPQLQPQLGELGPQNGTRTVPAGPAHPAAFSHKISTSDIQSLIAAASETSNDPTQRRTTLCPQMRRRGFCRLPSCPYVHEVCRPRKEFQPLWCANAPKSCKSIPCRFSKVLGCCPYADACVYSHAAMGAAERAQSAAAATGAEAGLSIIGHESQAAEDTTNADAMDTRTGPVKDSRASSRKSAAASSRPPRPTRPVRRSNSIGKNSGRCSSSKPRAVSASPELSTDSNVSRGSGMRQ